MDVSVRTKGETVTTSGAKFVSIPANDVVIHVEEDMDLHEIRVIIVDPSSDTNNECIWSSLDPVEQ